jgi:hypothetical protein
MLWTSMKRKAFRKRARKTMRMTQKRSEICYRMLRILPSLEGDDETHRRNRWHLSTLTFPSFRVTPSSLSTPTSSSPFRNSHPSSNLIDGVVVPLPVITEVDGLASPNGNQPQLVEAAQAALACFQPSKIARTKPQSSDDTRHLLDKSEHPC